MSRVGRLATCFVLSGVIVLSAGVASAQYSSKSRFGGEWRRANRKAEESRFFDWTRFTFEARFGPYWPAIDDEFEGSATPYADAFNPKPQFYFGAEVDWLFFRIPYLGVVGPGLGWGYTSVSTKARVTGTEEESGQDTSLWIMPMYLSAVLRADVLMREVNIPLVPYIKFGLGYGLWGSSSGQDTSVRDGLAGRGASLGTHLALGGMFSLSWLDSSGSESLRDATGLRSIYAFGEWMRSDLGGGSQMRIGTTTAIFGLAAQR
ncbi:MXAN_2562 family outer membrane beta-barrel protein [Chondromyces crocatus]|uniref:Outer membrane protein beta-barrel domain-containing protein n=1 Tax=Chondromyces crocatus TaxID=52 RepID=A0A0K1EF24_CHOCO|nr:MXAN_2562 family outer membrane beta-barrel protein [Chondromyces crocatus]AKT39454.1 uncharacterized protein CMC5_036010 [Chondromyces crocatus]